MLTPNGGQPVLYENYNGELIDWEDFFKKRDEHIELMKKGFSLHACRDCLWIKNAKWDERKKEFRYILLNVWTKCNLFCIYCSNHKDENVLKNTKEYNLIPVIKDMIDKGVVNENTKFDIAGGESTLDPHFNDLLALLIDNGIKNININTNALIYSESIKRGIEKGFVSIISSIDSGNPKKFEFIKKRNVWNQVWENIEKYSAAVDHESKKNENYINNNVNKTNIENKEENSKNEIRCNINNKNTNEEDINLKNGQNVNNENKNTVRTKFIIIPKINDTKSEIKQFVLRSRKANVSGVILNIDLHWLRQNFDDEKTMLHIIELTKYFIDFSAKRKVDYQVWAHIEDLIKRYNKLRPEKSVDINFIFNKNEIKKSLFEDLLHHFSFNKTSKKLPVNAKDKT